MTGMSRQDRDRWASARTLADLGELTARWLEGTVASQPGYCGPSDIEDPALVPLLATLNRSGFVTTGSQIGECGDGWEQRAAVEGFASRLTAQTLAEAADCAGMIAVLHPAGSLPRWRYRYGKSVTVARVNGEHCTAFGVQVSRCHIRSPHLGYGICHPDAVRDLCSACQVTLIDPDWGRPDALWTALAGAVTAPLRSTP